MKYKFLEHTADIKFQAFGKTIEKAFENSAYALLEVITKKIKIKPIIKKKISVKGKDKEALLYNFLEEFLFLLDANNFILSRINKIKVNENKNKEYELNAEIAGDNASNYNFTNNVKAITYNEMFVREENKNKEWVCQVVVDV